MNYKINVKCEIKNASDNLKEKIDELKKEFLDLNSLYLKQNEKVSNERNVTIYSNMDCSIEIVNVENEEDSISIGYLTQGMHEHFKLSKEKTYRIKVNKEVKGLNISITDAFKE